MLLFRPKVTDFVWVKGRSSFDRLSKLIQEGLSPVDHEASVPGRTAANRPVIKIKSTIHISEEKWVSFHETRKTGARERLCLCLGMR